MENNFINMCRTCYQEKPTDLLISLYEIEKTLGKMFKDILYDCTSIEIFADDFLPSFICKQCSMILLTSYQFKKDCYLSEEKFKNVLKESKNNSNDYENNQILIEPNEHVGSLVTTYFSDEGDNNELCDDEKCEKNVCSYCSKTFKTIYDLTVHIRRHTGTKPYICNICNKRFVSMGCLTSHSRVHSGETPFSCKICNKSFSHSSTLYKHVQSHKKQYVCDVCEKRFTSQSCLEAHKRMHSGLKPHKCKTCGKGFGDKKLLQRHSLVHIDDKPHLCNVCGNSFKRTSTLKKHMKIQHEIGKNKNT
nr:zinc finger protein 239-like [Onthophagus taurus]